MNKLKISQQDVIGLGGDPYSSKNILITLNMISGVINVYSIKTDFNFRHLFGGLLIETGEENRIPDITLYDVLQSSSWDFDFDWQDLNKLKYMVEHGMLSLENLCPICKQAVLEDVIVMIDECYSFFCSKCNNIVMLYSINNE